MRNFAAVGLAMLVVLIAGCGSESARLINDLRQTGLAYHNFHDIHQKGPSGWDELIEFDKSSGGDGLSIERVRDAGYQVKWDVQFSQLTAGLSETVMADKPGGGPVLMMDCSVR